MYMSSYIFYIHNKFLLLISSVDRWMVDRNFLFRDYPGIPRVVTGKGLT